MARGAPLSNARSEREFSIGICFGIESALVTMAVADHLENEL
jgi:hypothetical protein